MSPTRRMLRKSLVGVTAAAIVGPAGSAGTAVDAAPASDLGTVTISRTIHGQTFLWIDGSPEANQIDVVRHPDGSGAVTISGWRSPDGDYSRTKRLDADQVKAFFDIFTA